MSRKDYIAIAEAIRINTDSKEKDYLHKDMFISSLVTYLRLDNPNFDAYRFIEACGEVEN